MDKSLDIWAAPGPLHKRFYLPLVLIVSVETHRMIGYVKSIWRESGTCQINFRK